MVQTISSNQRVTMSLHSKQNKQQLSIEGFLLCKYEDAQASSRWLSKQSLDLQILANKRAVSLFNSLKKGTSIDQPKEIISISCSLRVAHEIHDLYKKAHRKNANFTSDDIVILDALDLNSFLKPKRPAKKRDFLQSHIAQILNWRRLGISYGDIESRLITIDGETVSAEYIRKTINLREDI